MKLGRAYEPYVEKVLDYTHAQMGELSVGSFCALEVYDDPEYSYIMTSRTVYKVIRMGYGFLTNSWFSCNLSLPEFIVEDVITGARKDLIRFTKGNLDRYTANYNTYSVTPTELYPFAQSCKRNRYGEMINAKDEGVISVGGIFGVHIRKMDKVAVKEFLENELSRERAKKEAEQLAIAKQRQAERERERQNADISEDELQMLFALLKKEK